MLWENGICEVVATFNVGVQVSFINRTEGPSSSHGHCNAVNKVRILFHNVKNRSSVC